MSYNLTFLDNSTLGLGGIVEGVNTASGGWLIGLLLIVTWIIIFITFYGKSEIEDLLLGSGFIIGLASGLLFTAGLLPPFTLIFPILSMIAGLLMKYMS
jgi:hypothetical protein